MSNVLVVGAGPVGLTMAAELARHGCRCRIIDRLAAPSGYCKAIGVTPRTLEVWEDMGVARPMIDAGVWLTGLRMIVPGQPVRDAMRDFSDLPYGELGIPQYQTERILTEHLARLGIAVERGVALSNVRDDGKRVSAELTRADGRTETAEFRFVVGCDGAHSVVRHAAGIGFPGDAFPMEFMLGDVMVDWDVPRGLAVFAIEPHDDAPPDFVVVIPQPERQRYRISMLAPPEPDALGGDEHGIMADRPGPSLDELQAVTDTLLPGKPRLADLRWSSRFRISMRIADKYRAGNLFIAGDAAHIHPPTGGQGMNTGIQDAYNLAWKMALVLRGAADEALLDSYEAERRPVGVDVVERTKEASLSFGRERKADRLADTQILVSYRDSAWVEQAADEPGPRAGDRAPDAHGLRRGQVGFPLRLFDVLRGTEHVVVVFRDGSSRAPDRALETLAQEIKLRYGDLVRIVALTAFDTPSADLIGVPLLRDAEGAFVHTYAVADGSLLVIRPDGYIGFRGRLTDVAGVGAFLGRTFAGTAVGSPRSV
jgi:2-polyprenyl-6-methoxyphenol hydroxylase-like FAD-dependent oxidoreductase